MKKHFHWWVTVLLVFALVFDFAVWGAVAQAPDFGAKLQVAARREAPLALMYMSAGSAMDSAVPVLDSWGQHYFEIALSDGFTRFKEDPGVAMDLIFSQTWNFKHGILKLMYWAAPLLAFVAVVLWARRPKKIRMGAR
jgi:hypothetical protein